MKDDQYELPGLSGVKPVIGLPDTSLRADDFIDVFELMLTSESDAEFDKAVKRLHRRYSEVRRNQRKYGLTPESKN